MENDARLNIRIPLAMREDLEIVAATSGRSIADAFRYFLGPEVHRLMLWSLEQEAKKEE